jgi:hypothetical protein
MQLYGVFTENILQCAVENFRANALTLYHAAVSESLVILQYVSNVRALCENFKSGENLARVLESLMIS